MGLVGRLGMVVARLLAEGLALIVDMVWPQVLVAESGKLVERLLELGLGMAHQFGWLSVLGLGMAE